MMKRLLASAVFGILLFAVSANATPPSSQLPSIVGGFGSSKEAQPTSAVPFQPNSAGPVTLSVSAVSSNVQLPSTDPTVVVNNTGANSAYVVFGSTNAATATTATGFMIPPGCFIPLYSGSSQGGAPYLAGITATSTTSLTITTGKGTALPECWTSTGGGSVSVSNLPATQNIASYESGSSHEQTATPGSTAHTGGKAVGGLFSIPVARANGGSGLINEFYAWTSWGSTVQYVVRLWDKNPTGTTCTDNSSFVGSATDDAHLITPPFSITFAAPASTTGDAKTYASSFFDPALGYLNQDGTTTKNIYACLVAVASDTPGATATLYVNARGPQN